MGSSVCRVGAGAHYRGWLYGMCAEKPPIQNHENPMRNSENALQNGENTLQNHENAMINCENALQNGANALQNHSFGWDLCGVGESG